jgi:hypothetical protein
MLESARISVNTTLVSVEKLANSGGRQQNRKRIYGMLIGTSEHRAFGSITKT